MDKQIIIADASPLIVFAKIKQLSLLAALGKVIVPSAVLEECMSGSRPGAIEIIKSVDKLFTVHREPIPHDYETLLEILGKGEASAIALASQSNGLLLIDEKLGREVAKKRNIKVIGSAGVLLRCKQKKLINKISPLIEELKSAGYYLSKKLIEDVLKRAKE